MADMAAVIALRRPPCPAGEVRLTVRGRCRPVADQVLTPRTAARLRSPQRRRNSGRPGRKGEVYDNLVFDILKMGRKLLHTLSKVLVNSEVFLFFALKTQFSSN